MGAVHLIQQKQYKETYVSNQAYKYPRVLRPLKKKCHVERGGCSLSSIYIEDFKSHSWWSIDTKLDLKRVWELWKKLDQWKERENYYSN